MNEKLIESFIEDRKARGIGKLRLQKYGYDLRNISQLLDKDFNKCNPEDIKKLVLKIKDKNWAEWTKYGHLVIFKVFWRWLKNEEHPKEIEWIKPRVKNGNKLPEELLTQEEIKKLINTTSNLKYKLLVSLLYESGARISEILDLKLKHISFEKDKPIVKLLVNGKTGTRRIPIYAAVPYLRKYLNEAHIDKNNGDCFLFYAKNTPLKRIDYNTIRLRLRWIKKKGEIKKAINPHIFRHSRASYLANFLTEAQMKHYFGWTQSSKMCQTYIHMSGRDIDDAILGKVYGLKEVKEEADRDETIKPKICMKCGLENPPTNKFCEKCNLALDIKTLIEQEEKDKKAESEIKAVFKLALDNPKKSFAEIMDEFRKISS